MPRKKKKKLLTPITVANCHVVHSWTSKMKWKCALALCCVSTLPYTPMCSSLLRRKKCPITAAPLWVSLRSGNYLWSVGALYEFDWPPQRAYTDWQLIVENSSFVKRLDRAPLTANKHPEKATWNPSQFQLKKLVNDNFDISKGRMHTTYFLSLQFWSVWNFMTTLTLLTILHSFIIVCGQLKGNT